MSRHAACPDARTLQEFALDKLGVQAVEGVRAHLAQCTECAATVETLKSNPGSTDPATGATGATGNNLEGGTELGETPTLTHSRTAEPDDSEDLPFLLRSANPKAIGKVDNYEVLRVLGRGGMGIVLDAF